MTLTVGELCAGAGGLSLAVADVFGDVEHRWLAENDPDASVVLRERFPGVPNLGDLTEVDWRTVEPVDVLVAGFPCTDISNAGKRAGIDGEKSGVWHDIARAIGVLRPRLVLLENVSALLVRGGPRVVGDLAAHFYVGSGLSLRASDVGAPHQRNRIFVAAASDADGEPIRLEPVAERARESAAVAGDDSEGVGGVALLPTPRASDGAGKSSHGRTWSATDHNLHNVVRSMLLPTPTTHHGRGGLSGPEHAAQRRADGRRMLDDAVALLPTPTSSAGGVGHQGRDGGLNLHTLLPTPAARDWKGTGYKGQLPNALLPTPRGSEGAKGGPNQRGSSGDLTLTSSVMLLPTPTATDADASRNATANRSHVPAATNDSGWTLHDVALAYADRWAQYAPAIARWETITGRPAPEPTVVGKRGGRRLSARFTEWLMDWPDGWVTDLVDNTAALRICGNGVVVRQGAEAYRRLLALMEATR